MKLFLVAILCVVVPCLAWMPQTENVQTTSLTQADSTAPPTIEFSPKYLTITKDTSRFLVTEIKVLNRGGAPLHISKVTPSCGCAAATVIKNPIYPLDIGKIRLQINTDTIKDTLMRVEYVIESDAETSPNVYSVWVRNPSAKK
ncbi:MAG: DUF1573 domain-containing protein [Candidatus Kapabacteria bacterium]|nr:DUF1573 domain-containing protein [Candidatus Kapabacteria bacterium]